MVYLDSTALWAAGEGNLEKVKEVANELGAQLFKQIVSDDTYDPSPFHSACCHGHINIVTYFVEEWHADVNQQARFDEVKLSKATPLWIAAYKGHLNVVKYLLSKNANINCTKNPHGSTALLIACEKGRTDIALHLLDAEAYFKAVDDRGYTCVMHACARNNIPILEALFDKGVNVNEKRPGGNVPLQDAATFGHVEIISFLVNECSICTDYDDLDPLMIAAVNGHTKAMEYLCKCPQLSYSKKAVIAAHEVTGASLILKNNLEKGKRILQTSFVLRKEAFGLSVLYSTPLALHLNIAEAHTCEKLDELNNLELEINSLLVLERVFGHDHPVVKEFLFTYAKKFRWNIKNHEFFLITCINLLLYCLELRSEEKNSAECFKSYFRKRLLIRNYLVFVFRYISFENKTINLYPYLKTVFESTMNEMRASIHPVETYITLLNFVKVISMNAELKNKMITFVKEAINFHPVIGGKSFLHYACGKETQWTLSLDRAYLGQRPPLELIRYLLACNADPNAQDDNKNTPLHVAMFENSPNKNLVIDTLIKHGAHIDCRNFMNMVPLKVLPNNEYNKSEYISLKCLAASAIQKHSICYKDIVPSHIYRFIEVH